MYFFSMYKFTVIYNTQYAKNNNNDKNNNNNI